MSFRFSFRFPHGVWRLGFAIAGSAACQCAFGTGTDSARQAASAGVPEVVSVGAVSPDWVVVTIDAGRIERPGHVPYQAQEGDKREPAGKPVLAWEDGKIARVPSATAVKRNGEEIGELGGDDTTILLKESFVGEMLDTSNLNDPNSYKVESPDDPAYREPRFPEAVSHKAKPSDRPIDPQVSAMEHRIYLRLPSPLKEGCRYSLFLGNLNTRQKSVEYTHDTRKADSEAIHVTAVGYRPDDPFKQAYLSTWLGTAGSLSRGDVQSFEIVDAKTGETVWEGPVGEVWPADKPEDFKARRNHQLTDVLPLDFSKFTKEGLWRVRVPGIGVSEEFPINRNAWSDAFKISMMGFLHHRVSLPLGPPLTDFVRPRNFHPEDGMKIFQIDNTTLDGESKAVTDSISRMVDSGEQWPTVPEAWGGYHDAGDWDRRSKHLSATMLHLELLALFPGYFENLKLNLPEPETKNALPDVLDEALWNLDFYRRLQMADGGVRGGVESTEHPRPAELSWQESLVVGCFAPDAVTSHRYAAAAARASRLLQKYDKALAATYGDSAAKAFTWAEANRLEKTPKGKSQNDAEERALAAVEMYQLTRDGKYHDIFKEATTLGKGKNVNAQQDASFAYALLPDDLADPELKQAAQEQFRKLAEIGLRFAEGNAFGLTTDAPGLPVIGYVAYFSVPGMISQSMCRAHHLLGDEKYLAGAVRAANFGAGANPDNLSYTTGIGTRQPRSPLHIDSRRSVQPAPVGITVYGPCDPKESLSYTDWAHKYFIGPHMVPNSRDWPSSESYVDIFVWPVVNEYTIHQTLGPNSYYWGYLAARP